MLLVSLVKRNKWQLCTYKVIDLLISSSIYRAYINKWFVSVEYLAGRTLDDH